MSTGVSDHTTLTVISWMADGMSNLNPTSSALMEFLGAAIGGSNGFTADDPGVRTRAEDLLLATPGTDPWLLATKPSRFNIAKLAARALAVEALRDPDPHHVWTRDDFCGLNDRSPGLLTFHDCGNFSNRLYTAVRREVVSRTKDVNDAAAAALTFAKLGHPSLRPLILEDSSPEVVDAANLVVCHASTFAPQLAGSLLLDYYRARKPGTFQAVNELFYETSGRAPQALWLEPGLGDLRRAVAARAYLNTTSQVQLHLLDEVPVPDEVPLDEQWLDAFAFLGDPDDRAAYYRRRDNDGYRFRGHGQIWQLVTGTVLDASGLPHAGRSAEENLGLLCDILGVAEVTRAQLAAPELTPLRKLVASALPVDARPTVRRNRTHHAVSPTVVVSALIAASSGGKCPAMKRIPDIVGFSSDEIEESCGMPLAALIGRLMDEGFLPEDMEASDTRLEQVGRMWIDDAVGIGTAQVSPVELLPADLVDEYAKQGWRRSRIDYVVERCDLIGGAPLIVEFDGPFHTRVIRGEGNLSNQQERDRTRHRQLNTISEQQPGATMLAVHYQLLPDRGDPLVTAPQLRRILRAARKQEKRWVYLRPTGLKECRAHLRGKPKPLEGVDILGVDVLVID